jgi:ABC-type glycerol-3-phosphate transport system substrate-binding protein
VTGSPADYSSRFDPEATTSRRRFVRTSIGLVAASASTIPRYATRAQDNLQELSLLFGTSTVPGANEFAVDLANRWGEQNSTLVNLEFAELVDLPARADRIIRGGEQRDIVELQELQPFRHSANLVDVSLIADAVIAEQGEYLPWAEQSVRVDGAWLSLPIGGVTSAITYRPSALEAIGIDSFPADWAGFLDLATQLKSSGAAPAGIALRQTPVAAPAFCYSYMWAHGGIEVDPATRSVSFNTPELNEALISFASAWHSGFEATGTQWDDQAQFVAFTEGRISIAIGSPDMYLMVRAIGDNDVAVAPMPAGPAGQFVPLGSRSLGIPTRSPNPDLALNFLSWWTAQAQYSQWIVGQRGVIAPANEPLMELPTYSQDTNLRPFVDALEIGRIKGYSASPSRASAEVTANYFVVNTFADIARGDDVATALDRGQRLMERFYTKTR